MLRTLWYFLKLALIVVAAIWLANRPGAVSLEWLGYRIDTSVGVLLLVAFVFGIVAAVTYRFWGLLLHTPKTIGGMVEKSRLKRGYKALTQGMVAVAAGDPEEARRLANKADGLLREPPLTLLLQAQAAQLQGDEGAARRYFEAMLENEETRFLGLRGLVTQCLREGDEAAALDYARKAYALRPKTPWLLEMLFDLSERSGDYASADRALKDWTRTKALPAPEGARKRAVLLIEQAREAELAQRRDEAVKLAKEAAKLAPELLAAKLLLARLLVESQRLKEAARVMERAWAAQPHPELVTLYKRARPSSDPIETLKTLNKLVEGHRAHEESRLALAEAALDAKLWGEARRYLTELVDSRKGRPPGERVCWLMARLEESEHGDAQKVREWLLRAGEAAPEPEWVCDSCGAAAERWTARCGACFAFDSLKWGEPPRVSIQGALTVGGERSVALPVAARVQTGAAPETKATLVGRAVPVATAAPTAAPAAAPAAAPPAAPPNTAPPPTAPAGIGGAATGGGTDAKPKSPRTSGAPAS